MSTSTRHETDVLIAGAGPAGLTLACELRRRGVACRLIDEYAEFPVTSRAVPSPREGLLADRLAQAIRLATTDDGMRRRAADLGERIHAEQGVARAVRTINNEQ